MGEGEWLLSLLLRLQGGFTRMRPDIDLTLILSFKELHCC